MKNSWVPMATNAAVVIGLILVIYELNQSHTQARAQMNMDGYASIINHEIALMGESPAAVISKARLSPEGLTDEEKIIVNAHLTARFEELSSLSYLAQIGVFNESWKDNVPFLANTEFDYAYARQWLSGYKQVGRVWDAEIFQLLEESFSQQ